MEATAIINRKQTKDPIEALRAKGVRLVEVHTGRDPKKCYINSMIRSDCTEIRYQSGQRAYRHGDPCPLVPVMSEEGLEWLGVPSDFQGWCDAALYFGGKK